MAMIGKPKGFDFDGMMSNPMLHAGVALLGSRGNQSAAPAALQGYMQGQQYQQQMKDREAAEMAKQKQAEALASAAAGTTDPVLQSLLGGGIETAKLGVDMMGKQMAANAATGDPAAVREYQFFTQLSPTEKQQFLAVKRAQQTYKQGDVTMGLDQLSRTSAPIQEAGRPHLSQPQAQQQATDQAAIKASAIKAGEQAIAQSGSAFEKLRTVGTSIANIDRAMQLLDEGAGTGPVMSMLPSVQQASVELDNLQGQMGLDVIANTTFGALSEAELKFALDTALPTGLKGPALKSWLAKKKDSQQKLQRYLEGAATYLGTPGNTVAGFIDSQKGARTAPSGDSTLLDAVRAERERRKNSRGSMLGGQ